MIVFSRRAVKDSNTLSWTNADGQDFRARFTLLRSAVPSSIPQNAGQSGKGRSLRCLPVATAANCLSLPLSLSLRRPTASLSLSLPLHWHLSPPPSLLASFPLAVASSSPVWFSARMFEFTRKWAWQPASHVASVVKRFNSYPMNYR